MAIVTVSAQPGLRADDIARHVADCLGFELITQARVESLYRSELGGDGEIPAGGYADLVTTIVAREATTRHLVFSGWGGEHLFRNFPGSLRTSIVAPAAMRAGVLMVEQGIERAQASSALRQLEIERTAWLRARFRRRGFFSTYYDVTLNAERWDPAALAAAIAAAAGALALEQAGLLSQAAERQLQFEARLRLARRGISALPLNQVSASRSEHAFAHPSEEVFANLLDFYRIAWDYEPRSFPIQWDQQGRAVEAFTPDFYLPEFDLYVELTTMKQSLVTKKNRKIKRLRELYPEVNVQVFYQKDFENLIFKYGLEKTAEMLK
jgi:hypothetical protein